VSSVAGPAIGGLLVSAVGAATAIAADAASYLASVFSLVLIRHREQRPQQADGRSRMRGLGHETREGLRYVLRHRTLRLIAASTGWSNLATSASGAVLTLFMVRRLHLSAAQIGAIFALASVGGFLGAVTSGRLLRRLGVGFATIAGAGVAAFAMLLVPLAQPGPAALLIAAGAFFALAGGVVYNIGQVSYRQAITPDHLLGRMNATMRFMVWGTLPIGSLIGGALGTTIGLHETLWVAAIAGLVAPLFVLISPLRHVREIPDDATVGADAVLAS
jgi:predicted MFS family arabinose efflux permease